MITHKLETVIRLLEEIRAELATPTAPSPLAVAIRNLLDHYPDRTFDLRGLVVSMRGHNILPHTIKRGDEMVKKVLSQLGGYVEIAGTGRMTTYAFRSPDRKPSLLSPSPSITVTF